MGAVNQVTVNAADVQLPRNHVFAEVNKSLQDYGAERTSGGSDEKKKKEIEDDAPMPVNFLPATKILDGEIPNESQVAAPGMLCYLRAGKQSPKLDNSCLMLAESPVLTTQMHAKAHGSCWPDCAGTTISHHSRMGVARKVAINQSYIDLIPPVNADPQAFEADVTARKKVWETKPKWVESSLAVFLEVMPTAKWQEFMGVCLNTVGPQGVLSAADDEKLKDLASRFGQCDVFYREESSGLTPLAFAVHCGGSADLIDVLIKGQKCPSLIVHPFTPSGSPLHLACSRGSVTQLKALMVSGGQRSPLLLVKTFCQVASPWEMVLGRHGTSNGGSAAREGILAYLIPLLTLSKTVEVQAFELFAAKHNAGVIGLPGIWADVAAKCAPPTNSYDSIGGFVGCLAAMPASVKQMSLLNALLEKCSQADLENDRTWQGGSLLHTLVAGNNAHGVSAVLSKVPSLLLTIDLNDRLPLTLALYRKQRASSPVVQQLLAPTLDAVKTQVSAGSLSHPVALLKLFTMLLSKKGLLGTEAATVWEAGGCAATVAGLPESDWSTYMEQWSVFANTKEAVALLVGGLKDHGGLISALTLGAIICKNTVLLDAVLPLLPDDADHSLLILTSLRVSGDSRDEEYEEEGKGGGVDTATIAAIWSKMETDSQQTALQRCVHCPRGHGVALPLALPDVFTSCPSEETADGPERMVVTAWGRSVVKHFAGRGTDGFGGFRALFQKVLTTEEQFRVLVYGGRSTNPAVCDAFDELIQDPTGLSKCPPSVARDLIGTDDGAIFGNVRLGTDGNKIDRPERIRRVARFCQHLIKHNITPKGMCNAKDDCVVDQDSDDCDRDNATGIMDKNFARDAPFHLVTPWAKGKYHVYSGKMILSYYLQFHTAPTDEEFNEKSASFVTQYVTFLKDVDGFLRQPRSAVALLCNIAQVIRGVSSSDTMVHKAISANAAGCRPGGKLKDYQIVLHAMRSCGAAAKGWKRNSAEDEAEAGEEVVHGDGGFTYKTAAALKEKTLYPLLLAQRLVERDASDQLMTHLITIFPEAITVVAATASKFGRVELLDIALAAAKEKDLPCAILPATNTGIAGILKHMSTGSDAIAFVPHCMEFHVLYKKLKTLHGYNSIALALFSRHVDAAHFTQLLEKGQLSDNNKPLTLFDLTFFQASQGRSFTHNFAALEHLSQLGVGVTNAFKQDSTVVGSPWLAHPLKAITSTGLSTAALNTGDRQLRVEQAEKMMALVKFRDGALIEDTPSTSDLSVAQKLLWYALSIDQLEVVTAIVASGKLTPVKSDISEAAKITSCILMSVEPAALKTTLAALGLLVHNKNVVKTVMVSERFDLAVKSEIVEAFRIAPDTVGTTYQTLAIVAAHHCKDQATAEMVIEKLGGGGQVIYDGELAKALASGNKASLLISSCVAEELEAEMTTILIHFLQAGHVDGALQFLAHVDDAACSKLIGSLNKQIAQSGKWAHMNSKLLGASVMGSNPAFLAKILSSLAAQDGGLTTTVYGHCAFAVLSLVRPSAMVGYLSVLADAREKGNDELKAFILNDASRQPKDEYDEDGGDGYCADDDTPPVTWPGQFGPGYAAPGERSVLLAKAGISPALSCSTADNGVELLKAFLTNIFGDKPDKACLPYLVETTTNRIELFHAGARDAEIKAVVVKVLEAQRKEDKPKTGESNHEREAHMDVGRRVLIKAIKESPSPSMYWDFLAAASVEPTEAEWGVIIERAAIMGDKAFFKLMEVRGWAGTPDLQAELPPGGGRGGDDDEEGDTTPEVRVFRAPVAVPAMAALGDHEELTKQGGRPFISAIQEGTPLPDSEKPVEKRHVEEWMKSYLEGVNVGARNCPTEESSLHHEMELEVGEEASLANLNISQLQQVELSPLVSRVVDYNPRTMYNRATTKQKKNDDTLDIIRAFANKFEKTVCTKFKFSVVNADKATLTISTSGEWHIEVGTKCFNTTEANSTDGDAPPRGVQVEAAAGFTTDALKAILHLNDHLGGGKTFRGKGGFSNYVPHTFQTVEGDGGHLHTGPGGSGAGSAVTLVDAVVGDDCNACWTVARGMCIVADYYWPYAHDNLLYDVSIPRLFSATNDMISVSCKSKSPKTLIPVELLLGADEASVDFVSGEHLKFSLKVPSEADAKEMVQVTKTYQQSGMRLALRSLIEGKGYGPELPWTVLDEKPVQEAGNKWAAAREAFMDTTTTTGTEE